MDGFLIFKLCSKKDINIFLSSPITKSQYELRQRNLQLRFGLF